MHAPTAVSGSELPLAGSTGQQDFEDFIYLISHDVRASVRALQELPQWIVEDLDAAGVKIDGQVAQSIELMNRHTGRLDRMLIDLLTYSRIGRMQAVCLVDLDAALTQVTKAIKVPRGFDVARSLECSEVLMGETDILTMLDALITNSIKHHDKPGGQVGVTSRRDGDAVVVTVSDDGPGISKAFDERVFGAMITLRPRDEVEGSGMGLALVRKIADSYQGQAKIIPSPNGIGTTVEVRIAGQRCS